MNNLDKNWNNLFGEYTADETAWHGQWTVYSPNQADFPKLESTLPKTTSP